MTKKKITKNLKTKPASRSMKEQHIDIRAHRDRLKELQGPRAGAAGWVFALLGMAALLWLMNNPF